MGDSHSGLSTRQVLIDATVRRLWAEDESELRILDLCQETNLSTSVIYGHFRSRQGLIDASLLHIFSIVTEEIIDYLRVAVTGAETSDSFIDTLYDLLVDPAREANVTRQRQMFFRVSASALSRPSIRPGFLELYGVYMERVDEIYRDSIERGLLSDQLTARQWALFLEGQMLSRAFHDLSSNWDNQVDWLRAARLMRDASRND